MSIWLKKRTAGSAPGVEWTSDGDVQEVRDETMALELLERRDGEFTEVDPPAGSRPSDEAKSERDGREVAETGTGNATKSEVAPATDVVAVKSSDVVKPPVVTGTKTGK